MTSWRSGTVRVSGGFLAYHRTGGDRPPLLLSHGLTDNGLCWSRLASALEADFDVVMLDARGHGASARLSPSHRHDPVRDIAEAVEALGLASPVVMGHSVGARATAAYANDFPDRVSKVILEDPPFLPIPDAAASAVRERKFREEVARFQAMSEAEIIALGRSRHPTWSPDEFPAWAAAKRQVDPGAMPTYATAWQAQIAQISAPTLLIHGDVDLGSLVTPEIAAEAMSLNAGILAVRIADAGHNVRRENFGSYFATVRAFLQP